MPDYEKISRLGEGNYGEVWLVYDKALDVKRAVKYIAPSRITDPTEFYKEPKILMKLRHDYIVKVEDAGKDGNGNLYIAMEYLPKGSLKDIFQGHPVLLKTALRYLCDVCWGLEYAHVNGYIHRDIKPANILIEAKGKAKLSDFGLATQAPRGSIASPNGYLTHLSPEVFTDGITSIQTDIYAMGVTAYRIVNGDSYVDSIQQQNDLEDLIVNGKYPDRKHYRPFIPLKVRKVINKAMNIDPSKRYKRVADFRRALEGISLHCDWGWEHKENVVTYKTKIGKNIIRVTVTPLSKKKFAIITTCKRKGGKAHRVMKDCFFDLTKNKMKSLLLRILSRYVAKGK